MSNAFASGGGVAKVTCAISKPGLAMAPPEEYLFPPLRKRKPPLGLSISAGGGVSAPRKAPARPRTAPVSRKLRRVSRLFDIKILQFSVLVNRASQIARTQARL